MSNNKKTQASYVKPSRADIVRSVATSTAVETGQSSAKIEASLEATRKNSLICVLRFNPFLMLH
jgi:hypothetical protein